MFLVTVLSNYVARRNYFIWMLTPQHLLQHKCRISLPRGISKRENELQNIYPMSVRTNCLCQPNAVTCFPDANFSSRQYTLEQVQLYRPRRLPWICAIACHQGYHTPSGSHQSHGLYGTSFWSILLEIQSTCAPSCLNLSLNPLQLDALIRQSATGIPLLATKPKCQRVLVRIFFSNFGEHPNQKLLAPITRTT